MADEIALPEWYGELLGDLKQRVRAARLQTQRTVNADLIALYWQLGRSILQQQAKAGWGSRVVDQLAKDLPR